MRLTSIVAAVALTASSIVAAHPGHNIEQEIAERAEFLKANTQRRDLSHCAAQLKARGFEASTIKRRAELMRAERRKRGISVDAPYLKARDIGTLAGRDVGTVLATDHESPIDYTPGTDAAILFAGNSSCILQPETTEGPYYVSGEYIRPDVRNEEDGVDLIIDLQVIDVATCEPVPAVYMDLWACNSTGVYGGVVARGNGNILDLANINNTMGRGLQQTSEEGVAQFTTIFPGHYTGRAHHIHIATHLDGVVLPNSTFRGTTVSHIGQVFFDQDLITEVEATSPYSGNTQPLTTNAQDGIFAQEAATSDPVAEYSLLGADVTDGIFAWLAFGVDLTYSRTISAAANYGEDGGVALPGSGGGPGGPPPAA